jgi:alanyl-tRNA synthetase
MIVGVPADRPVVVIAINEAARGIGVAAGTLVGGAARALGGGGGGKPDVAQGGGAPNAGIAEVNAAFEAVRDALRDSERTGG